MIAYLLKSILFSGLFLLAYHLFLEKEKMHRFNRFYLLFAIIFSILAPLITIETYSTVLSPITQDYLILENQPIASTGPLLPVETTPNGISIFVLIYSIISLLLLTRLVYRLFQVFSAIPKNEMHNYDGVKLLLVKNKILPHTFLNYVFLPKEDYETKKVEPEILSHELTHAHQKHSLDILFLELVQTVCWFNPVLFLYRKAIQLNHEFLADDSVIKEFGNTSSYQYLLLEKAGQNSRHNLASQFNFLRIKKRLTMMTKNTSPRKALLMQLAVAPFLLVASLLFCIKNIAQDTTLKNVPRITIPEHTTDGASKELMDEFSSLVNKYKETNKKNYEKYASISEEDRNRLETIFKSMSRDQQSKSYVIFLPPMKPLPKIIPTAKQIEAFSNPKMYGVWINDKKVSNDVLKKYKYSDFSHYFISKLYGFAKAGVNYYYQVDMMTNSYYEEDCKKTLADKRNRMMIGYPRRVITPTSAVLQ